MRAPPRGPAVARPYGMGWDGTSTWIRRFSLTPPPSLKRPFLEGFSAWGPPLAALQNSGPIAMRGGADGLFRAVQKAKILASTTLHLDVLLLRGCRGIAQKISHLIRKWSRVRALPIFKVASKTELCHAFWEIRVMNQQNLHARV